MLNFTKITVLILLTSSLCVAGFRMASGTDPDASDLKAGQVKQAVTESAKPVTSSAALSTKASAAAEIPKNKLNMIQRLKNFAASFHLPFKLPSKVKTPPTESNIPSDLKMAMPNTNTRSPSSIGNIPAPISLPSKDTISVSELNLPADKKANLTRDFSLQLKKMNHAEVLKFSVRARNLVDPKREYLTEVKGRTIAEKYSQSLKPFRHQAIRTKTELQLTSITPTASAPTLETQANFAERVDALCLGLDEEYPRAVDALFELSQRKSNPVPLQAKDALFAGILAQRAGWWTSARFLMEESAFLKIEQQRHYLEILWTQLDEFEDLNHIESIVKLIKPKYLVAPIMGDKANFLLAKKMISQSDKTNVAFAENIKSSLLKEKLELLKLMSARKETSLDVENGLRDLISNSKNKDHIKQAGLSLARLLSKQKQFTEAAEAYKSIERDHQNHMDILLEVAYADYTQKRYQESLGKSLGLQTPYFQYGFSPDVHFVEILNRRALCDFGGAEQGMLRLKDRYQPELTALIELENRNPNHLDYYRELIAYKSALAPFRFQRALLKTPIVLDNQKTINQGEKEISLLKTWASVPHRAHLPESWPAFLQFAQENWNDYSQGLKTKMAQAARTEARYQRKHLSQIFAQVELFALDNAASATKNFQTQSALNFPVQVPQKNSKNRQMLYWPFEQEVWEDELDDLKVKTASKCTEREAIKQASLSK